MFLSFQVCKMLGNKINLRTSIACAEWSINQVLRADSLLNSVGKLPSKILGHAHTPRVFEWHFKKKSSLFWGSWPVTIHALYQSLISGDARHVCILRLWIYTKIVEICGHARQNDMTNMTFWWWKLRLATRKQGYGLPVEMSHLAVR